MRASEAFQKVSEAMTAIRLTDAWGDPIEGLCALSSVLRELPLELREKWEAIESQLEFASTFESLGFTEQAAEVYCREALGLVHYATMKIRKRAIDREVEELAFCAREES